MSFPQFIIRAFSVAAISLMMACSSSNGSDSDDDTAGRAGGGTVEPTLVSITVSPTTLDFILGETAPQPISVVKNYSDNSQESESNYSVSFSDNTVALFNNGFVAGVELGASIGTITIEGVSTDFIVRVLNGQDPVDPVDPGEASFSMSVERSTANPGETVCVTGTYTDENGTQSNVTNSLLLTISPASNGTVTGPCATFAASANGTTTFTARSNGLTDSANVFVNSVNPGDTTVASIEITDDSYTIGSVAKQLQVTGYNSAGQVVPVNNVSWKSLNEAWLSVDSNGNASTVDAKWGYGFVEATAGGHVATAKFTLTSGAGGVCNGDASSVTIHYQREDSAYSGWGLHLWGDGWATNELTTWTTPASLSGRDGYGAFAKIDVQDPTKELFFIVHKGNEKDPSADLTVPCGATDVYILSGDDTVYIEQPSVNRPAHRRAIWNSASNISWASGGSNPTLYYSETGSLSLSGGNVTGGETISLSGSGGNYSVNASVAQVKSILKSQVWLRSGSGNVTGLQIANVIDSLYNYSGELGPIYSRVGGAPTLKVWAPTAQSVRLRLFDDANTTTTEIVDMTEDSNTGVWSVTGSTDWDEKYYLYEVKVYHPLSDAIETSLVTDPYSVTLSKNSQRSQLINLDDSRYKPFGWDNLVKDQLNAPEDASIYELHIRDFRSAAQSNDLAANYRGKYKAFTAENYSGMQHLEALADAGLTHLHLMPTFDIATINEDEASRDDDKLLNLGSYGANSDSQSELVAQFRTNDAFNWGYDPLHYGAPEGSYATDPDGVTRVIEFREMVMAIDNIGLKVVMDVVYNHTSSSGLWFFSVLDRIVPGYYHRLDGDGKVQTSTCCDDTASEHNMMEKLMVDTLVRWARDYKIDSFRFDLMGHHLKRNIQAVRNGLNGLTKASDGTDGKNLYLYGEGWDFGGIQDQENMDQWNAAGTGVGTYNDRIRDAATGGPHEDTLGIRGVMHGDFGGIGISKIDKVRIGMAGNLRNYWNGDSGTGYTFDPQENMPYISKHDNYTLWDMSVAKLPSLSIDDRVKMQNMALGYVVYAQGIPFLHAGVDLLRSKSGDRNSYDSGDWYNSLDFTGNTHKWGSGLPPLWGNPNTQSSVWGPLLADDKYRPSKAHIESAKTSLREMLAVRADVKLLRLETADQIRNNLSFDNSNRTAHPGVIVMRVNDSGLNIDSKYHEVLVVINAGSGTFTQSINAAEKSNFQLHPAQASLNGQASVNGKTVTVPGRTAAVFVAQ